MLSVVIPCYNERDVVSLLFVRLRAVLDQLDEPYEVIIVDDASHDGMSDVVTECQSGWPELRLRQLAGNVGHQLALTAGLELAVGDFVVTMDADLQDPPAVSLELIREWQDGWDVVYAQRRSRRDGPFKRASADVFYRILGAMSSVEIPRNTGDFRLIDRAVADQLRRYGEHSRFLRGMISWVGYRSIILPYREPDRLAGRSKYSLRKMIRLAMDAIFSFSLMPLYIGLSAGGLFFCLAALEVIYVLSFWVTGRTSNLASGWSSLMFVILIVGGTIMILLGFIGVALQVLGALIF